MTKVVILDYGLGNLANVARAIQKFTDQVFISDQSREIASASHLILPGVGAFGDGILELQQRELVDAIQQHVQQGKPLLGICLGMQLLFSDSEEFGFYQGLNIIAGSVKKMPANQGETRLRKIPHIGWSALALINAQQNSIFHHINQSDEVYFVHSYMAHVQDASHVLATIDYCGLTIPAIVNKDNVFGMQFHPEKSAQPGLQLINNFLES